MAEKQYADYASLPRATLGLTTNVWYANDPRHLLFTLARYKFVAKMLAGKNHVLEIGCGDGFCTRLVQQTVEHVTAIDFDPAFIRDVVQRMSPDWPLDMFVRDILTGPCSPWEGGRFDAAYSLDVLEHIAPDDEPLFMRNVCASLVDGGVLIIGMPSTESQAYASEGSKAGHINCHTGPELAALMREYFENVFSFSMNDEVVHTGYAPMAQYLFAIGVGKR